MKRFNPIIRQTTGSKSPVIVHDQAYDTLLLPAAGVISWTALGHIVVEYNATAVPGPFALVSWPRTDLPLFVRDNGKVYYINNDQTPKPIRFATRYSGQTLSQYAIFEIWAAGPSPGSVTLPDIALRISHRTQLCCGETEGTQWLGSLYVKECNTYPLCFPICI